MSSGEENTEFEVSGQQYQAGKLSPMDQLNVTRRVLPLLAAIQAEAGGDKLIRLDMTILVPLSTMLSRIPDADIAYIMNNTLKVVKRRIAGGTGWAPVWSVQAQNPMFEDIGLPEMLTMVYHVLERAVIPFLSASPPSSIGGRPAEDTSQPL